MNLLGEMMVKYYKKIAILDLDKLHNKTILITGASGLIGSNLVSYLNFINEEKKFNLKIVPIVRSKSEKWLPKSKNIKYLRLDLAKQKIPALKFDYLIHCATYAQPKKFLAYPEETVFLNTNILFDLLNLAKKNHASFLYLSSAEIYGQPDKDHTPTDESYLGYVNTLSERAIYSESKRLAETICFLYKNFINVKIARLHITYGPGIKYDDKRVISEFIVKAQQKKEVVMMDEGNDIRSLCFISDAVEMLLNILLSSKDIVYNICGKETKTIKEIAQIIAKLNSAVVTIEPKLKQISGTPKQIILSNRKYLEEFPKKDFINLDEGLEITSEWLKIIKNLNTKQ